MKALRKSTRREIRKSLGRYLAILAIVALGVGFFSGLRVCRDAMVKTGDDYLSRQRMFDYRLISTMGFSRDDAAFFEALQGVEDAEGSVSIDALFDTGDAGGSVLMAHSLTERLNLFSLVAGRMPQTPDELVADAQRFGIEAVGQTLSLSSDNDADTLDMFAYRAYTVVGVGNSPSYMNYERGSTSLGNGTVAGFVYMPLGSFACDYFTEIYVRCDAPGAIYSDAYQDGVTAYEGAVTASGEERAAARYEGVVSDAEAELSDGRAEYIEGWLEYRQKRAEAESELWQARDKLVEGDGEVAENERKLLDGEAELSDARGEYGAGAEKLASSKARLLSAEREAYAQLDAAQALLEEQRAAATEGVAAIEQSGVLAQYESLQQNRPRLAAGIEELGGARAQLVGAGDALRAGIASAKGTASVLEGERSAALADVQAQREAAAAEIESLQGQLAALRPGDDERIAALNAELSDMRARKEALEGRISAAETDYAARVAAADDAAAARAGELSQAESELSARKGARDAAVGELEGRLSSAISELSSAQGELADLDAEAEPERAAELKGRIDTLSAQKSALEGELSVAQSQHNARVSEAERERDEAAARAAQAGADAEALAAARDGELSALAAELSAAEAAILAAESELAGLSPSPDAAERERLTSALSDKRQQLSVLDGQLSSINAQYDAQIAAAEGQATTLAEQLSAHEASYGDNLAAIDGQLSVLSGQLSQVDAGLRQIEDGGYVAQYRQLEEALVQLEAGLQQVAAQRAAADEQFAAARRELSSGRTQLSDALAQIEDAEAELRDGRAQLEEAKVELSDGHAEYEEARAEADAEFADAEAELRDAADELADARQKIDDIEAPDVYVLDRTANVGYMCFDSDSQIVQGISQVFPLFFFMVAALVCMTTMTRMVDEQRTQIGVLKALGYSSGAILWKYVFYAGSAATLGSLLGFFVGSALFPKVIWMAYDIMYGFSEIKLVYDWGMGAASLAVALLCSVGATWFSVRRDLRMTPAALMRPQAPKAGKRIFLEHVGFVWRRLKFLQKVAIRNIVRYKKRLVMMVIGIGGCTALLVTGLGIRDSISDVVNYQFEEITLYDIAVSFTSAPDEKGRAAFLDGAREATAECLFLHESAADFSFGGATKSVNLVATDAADISPFVDLHAGDEPIALPGADEAVISEGLRELTGADVGSVILLRDGDMREMRLTVSAVFDNYVYNYVYVRPETCLRQWGYAPEVKAAFVNAPEGADIYAAAAKLAGQDGVGNVTVNQELRHRVNDMMENLDYIVMLIVFSAGALAFIVLYNLTNINITERTREIATIKVLGFYPKETASYVFSENLLLCLISALAGLPMGKWLHSFVMAQIKVDMMHFDARVAAPSYLLAIALTFVFAGLVSFALRFKLDRINMAESLKTVE